MRVLPERLLIVTSERASGWVYALDIIAAIRRWGSQTSVAGCDRQRLTGGMVGSVAVRRRAQTGERSSGCDEDGRAQRQSAAPAQAEAGFACVAGRVEWFNCCDRDLCGHNVRIG